MHELLDASADVHVFAIPEPEPASELIRSGDIARTTVLGGRLEDEASVRRAVQAARPELVFHLGAQTLVGPARGDPTYTFRVNIAGTWNLLEALRLAPPTRAIAVASSDKAYGRSDHLPYVEADALAGEEPYEASKVATDVLGRTYATAYGLPVRIARCGNVYGPGDVHWSRLVPGTIRSFLEGTRPIVRSDGTLVRDYLHVADAVTAYLALMQPGVPHGEAFNFSSGERRTVLEVVRIIGAAVGSALEPVIEDTAKGELREQYLDSSKARRELGWSARRDMPGSLGEIISWYRQLLGKPSTRKA